ncbi:hypothetical protein BJX99DRAFT_216915, partial [Aspergillus californicus]
MMHTRGLGACRLAGLCLVSGNVGYVCGLAWIWKFVLWLIGYSGRSDSEYLIC